MPIKYKLPNKLSVILIESKKAPVVSIQLWVKTGSADEEKGQEGISHFIEHLVFKGTDEFGVGEVAKTIEGHGGELNAYTTFDQTVFYVTMSRHYSEMGLKAISQMMGFPTFDGSEIDNEREVVIEEIKRSNDSPGSQASRILFENAYRRHPYGIPVIGYDKIIKSVSREKILKYFGNRYVPSNMILVVAGDFETKEMKAKVAQYFGAFKAKKLKQIKRKREAAQSSPRIVVKQAPFGENYIYISWQIPDIKHKDIVALDLLSMVFGEGDTSLLYRKLRLESPTVNYVGSSTFTLKDPGLAIVVATLNKENIQDYFAKLLPIFKEILSRYPSGEEIKRAVTQLESDEYYDIETVDGLTRKAGYLEYFLGDFKYYPKYLKKVHATKAEDLLRVARKYFDPKKMCVSILTNEHKGAVEKTVKNWLKDYKKTFTEACKEKPKKENSKSTKGRLKPPPVKFKKSLQTAPIQITQHTLNNGSKVIFRVTKDTPVISAKVAMLGGLRLEEFGREGLTELLSRVWPTGTSSLNEQQINSKVEAMAARFSCFSGRNSAGGSLTLLNPFEREGLDLFCDVLINPAFSADIIDREKLVMKEAIKTQKDQPAHIAFKAFLENIFKDHPYGRDMMGSLESVDRISKQDVLNHYKKMAAAGNVMAVVSGAIEPKLWLEKFNESLGALKSGVAKNQFPIAPLVQDKTVYEHLQKEQTHIVVGYRGHSINSPDRYVLQIMQSILAGQGGRLFLELRDKASLAYSVSPVKFEGLETGYFGAYIGCSPDKSKKALEMLDVEFKKLATQKPSEEELERAKKNLIGRHDIELQKNSAFASAILFNELYGISSDEIFKYADFINSVSTEDVRRLAGEIFKQNKVTVAIGSSNPWD